MLSDVQEIQQKHQEILGSRIFNPAMVLRSWKIFSPWEAYKGSLTNHKQAEKRWEIISMPIVIASLVTRLNLVESKKLICENCHSGAAGIRGGRNNSVTNYILQRLIKSWLFPFPICFFQSATVSCVSKSTNLSRRDHRCILPFFWFPLFDFFINYSNWLSCD